MDYFPAPYQKPFAAVQPPDSRVVFHHKVYQHSQKQRKKSKISDLKTQEEMEPKVLAKSPPQGWVNIQSLRMVIILGYHVLS